MSWKIHQLPSSVTAGQWLARVSDLPRAFLLQSGRDGRYDILGADPAAVMVASNGQTRVTLSDGHEFRSAADPFSLVDELVNSTRPASPCPIDLPFTGGAVGSIGYETAYRLERLGEPVPDAMDFPAWQMGIYPWCIVRDRVQDLTFLLATPAVSELDFERLRGKLSREAPAPDDWRAGEVVSSFSRRSYQAALERILGYIHAGDCYQVNLAQRFEAGFEGDPLGLFDALMGTNEAPFGACLMNPDHCILSFSPERFIRVRGDHVVTQPIKGTRPRGHDESTDAALAFELVQSEKDRAENLMIVDLLRNDLGRCCAPGTIRAERLFELQSFSNVHHLVSTVEGRLQPGVTPMALLRSCFPGGSITGAPKIRAMEIIRELEPVRRGPYCGAIGYYSYNGNLDTNLSIRTLVCGGGRIRYWGGGGIVADSTADGEYEESLAKVAFIREALSRPRRSAHAARRTR